MRKFLLSLALLLLPFGATHAQMLALNVEAPPGITVTVLSDGVLDFGTLLQNQGQVSINLMDAGAEVIRIESARNRDLSVTLSPPPSLQLDANNSLPFTLGASYTNTGENDKTQAVDFPDSYSDVYPAYDDQNTSGPPPWACNDKKNNPNNNCDDTNNNNTVLSYIYLYGDTTVGYERAGTYTGIINLNVSYAN
jgi:hypothetical protein